MNPLEAADLPSLPAWFWFIELFKVLGFSLHMIPMNLWYAGVIVALALHAFGNEHGRRFGSRLMLQMPIIIALGINFGIVPLLFLQLAYAKAFYPATILMAWFWFAIILYLIPAYYGVYLYSFGLTVDGRMTSVKRAAGWVAAILFILIGFTFANGLSLTAAPENWHALWQRHSVAGAATGTALNVADPSLWPRWLLMFGFALITTSAWSVIDAAWLAPHESEQYRGWIRGFSWQLGVAGAVVATLAGAHYVFATWSTEVRASMLTFPGILLSVITGASPWFAPALMWLWRNRPLGRGQAAVIAACVVGMIALNAISRQIVQNLEISRLFKVWELPVEVQGGPMAMFLLAFLSGVGGIGWIVAQILRAKPSEQV